MSHKPVVVASLALGLLLASAALAAQTPPKPLTVAEIFAHGPIIGEMPSGISWSPDGKHLTYIDGGELIDIDPVSGDDLQKIVADIVSTPKATADRLSSIITLPEQATSGKN